MKFSARSDFDLRVEQVFAVLADFERHERAVLRRGVDLQREDDGAPVGVGSAWRATVRFRGKDRNIRVAIDDLQLSDSILYGVQGQGIAGSFSVQLIELSRQKSRMMVALDIKPLNLSGKLIIRSLRLVKPSLNRRFKDRVDEYSAYLQRQLSGR